MLDLVGSLREQAGDPTINNLAEETRDPALRRQLGPTYGSHHCQLDHAVYRQKAPDDARSSPNRRREQEER
jgi:hypothetical protein